MLAKLPMNANRSAIGIVSAVAQHNVAAGLGQADRSSKTPGERATALSSAAGLLARTQM